MITAAEQDVGSEPHSARDTIHLVCVCEKQTTSRKYS